MPPAQSVTGLLATEALAPSKPAVRVLTAPSPLPAAEAATWLLCEVSNFSPLGILLAWLEGQREVDPSWSATARPAAQPGNSSFRTWSVLRVPAFPGRAAATYTCVVRHEASRTLLSASWNLDTGGESCGLGASIRAGGRRWAGGGGAAPEEPGSGDQAAARLECTPPCPGGSGCPGSCPIRPGPVSTHHVLAQEGWEVGPPPQSPRSSHLPPRCTHLWVQSRASPGLGVRVITPDSGPPGASKPPQPPRPPPIREHGQHLGSQICPEAGAGLGHPRESDQHTPTAGPDHTPLRGEEWTDSAREEAVVGAQGQWWAPWAGQEL